MTEQAGRSLADIAARHRQEGGTVTFDVAGETFVARRVCSAADLMKIEKFAALQARVADGPNANTGWQQWGPVTETTVRMAAYMTQLLIEPKCTMAEALMLAGTAGAFFLAINGRLMEEIGLATAEAEEEAIVEEGESSEAADGTGS